MPSFRSLCVDDKICRSFGPTGHSDPRVRRVVEAGGEATAVMSRLQALETKSTSATTSVGQRFTGMEATQCKPHVWSGEKNSELLTSFRMELQLCRITA